MTQFDLDTETFVLFPLFALGAAATLGLVSADILPWFNLGDVVVSFASIDWTIGRLLAIAALGGVLINRDEPLDFETWGAIEVWTFYVTIGLILAPPFFPAFAEFQSRSGFSGRRDRG
jgi:hypothetical protein